MKTSLSHFKDLYTFVMEIPTKRILMTTKTIVIEEIEIRIKKSSRARYMNISVKPFGGVTISIPEMLSFYDGEKLAHQKIKWIKEHVSKIRGYEKTFSIYDENSNFRTRNHQLEIKSSEKNKLSIKVRNGLIKVHYPEKMDAKSSLVQKAVRKGIETAYREEAKEYLPKRLNDLSDKCNLPFNEIFIKNIKSRWGSCSGKNNINLSIHLMRLPDHLIDYVLLHELAHTKIKNHSKKYWQFLDTLTGNAKQIDKELRKFRISLY
ncbi:MAG: SprT family zinc-dependent metalloprotease [Ignavibacteriales bacterium]|nr:SprT family zinc-dependent metalloprotease [Ignavibacteriales bacterium]